MLIVVFRDGLGFSIVYVMPVATLGSVAFEGDMV